MDFLAKEKERGKKIYIYGASTRGQVILHYANITNKLIAAATDKNSDKWGKSIAGTGIPIITIDEYRSRKPDYLLVLPYHFIEEIKKQEKEFLMAGGKMIVPIPQFKIIGKTSLRGGD